MSLSEREQRDLAAIEASLVSADPKLARRFSVPTIRLRRLAAAAAVLAGVIVVTLAAAAVGALDAAPALTVLTAACAALAPTLTVAGIRLRPLVRTRLPRLPQQHR